MAAIRANAVETVDLDGSEVTDAHLLPLFAALKVNTSVTAISLRERAISDTTAQSFAEIAEENTQLIKVVCRSENFQAMNRVFFAIAVRNFHFSI